MDSTMPAVASNMLKVMAMSTGWPVWKKKTANGTVTITLSSSAAARTYVRQLLQQMTVMAMKNSTWHCRYGPP